MQATFAFLLVAGLVCAGRHTNVNGRTTNQWVIVSSNSFLQSPAAVADLDGDGWDDLAAGTRWFLVRPDGSWEEIEAPYAVPATGFAGLEDTDGDGAIDRLSFAGEPFPPPR